MKSRVCSLHVWIKLIIRSARWCEEDWAIEWYFVCHLWNCNLPISFEGGECVPCMFKLSEEFPLDSVPLSVKLHYTFGVSSVCVLLLECNIRLAWKETSRLWFKWYVFDAPRIFSVDVIFGFFGFLIYFSRNRSSLL